MKLARTGGVVLSGDLYHYPAGADDGPVPTFEFSEAQTRAARRQLETFLQRTGARCGFSTT